MLFVYKAILGVLVYTSEDLEKQIRASLYAIWNISACGKNPIFDFSFSVTPLFYGITGKFNEDTLRNVLGNLSAEVNRHSSNASNFSDQAAQQEINNLHANLASKDKEIMLLKSQNSKYQRKNMIQEERNLNQSIDELQVQIEQNQNVDSQWSRLYMYPKKYQTHIHAAENLALQAGNEAVKLGLGEYEGRPCPAISYSNEIVLINYRSPGESKRIKDI